MSYDRAANDDRRMHDERFKKLLREFFAEFFWLFFPGWAARFDFNRIDWLEQELMNDALEGESRFVDLIAKLPTLEPLPDPGGRSADSWLVLVHVEIESADKVAPLRQRMFHYYEPLRRRHGLPVLPIGLYLRVGLDGIGWDSYEERFWGQQLVCFNYAYVGLPGLEAENYIDANNLFSIALTALMKVSRERKIELAGRALERIVNSPESSYRKALLCDCVSAYLPVDDQEWRQFEKMIRNHPDPGVKAMQLSVYDHVERRGKLEGMLEGQREIVRTVLESRFGPLSMAAATKLDAMTSDRLTELASDLTSATSLAELGLGEAQNGGS